MLKHKICLEYFIFLSLVEAKLYMLTVKSDKLILLNKIKETERKVNISIIFLC